MKLCHEKSKIVCTSSKNIGIATKRSVCHKAQLCQVSNYRNCLSQIRNLGLTHQILIKMFTYVVKRFGLSNQMPNVNREPIGRVTQSHSCNNNMQSEKEFERTFTPR